LGILDRAGKDFPRLSKLWADSGYQGAYPKSYCQDYGIDLEIAKRSDRNPGFKIEARRWVVKRTFAWLGRERRMAKDYEYQPINSEVMICLSMLRLMLRRVARCVQVL
jgi:putative transposase